MSKTVRFTLAEILHGKVAGRPQSVGIMDVVPLLPQDEAHHNRLFAVPSKDMYLAGNPGYGTVIVRNANPAMPLICPTNTAWVTRHRAQDHALCKAGLVKGGATSTYNNAACVQATQGGAIPADLYQFQILPATLRRLDRTLAEKSEFRKMWDNIRGLNQALNVPDHAGHLEYLFKQFEKELSQFVAEFESISDQIGALILINGQLVGVEIAPSPEYWTSVWEPLIRYCYGPEALLAARRLEDDGVQAAILDRPTLRYEHVQSLDELKQALEQLRQEEMSRVENIVHQNLETSLEFTVDESISVAHGPGDETTYELASAYEDFIGQVVLDEGYVVYASLVNGKRVPRRPARGVFRFLRSAP